MEVLCTLTLGSSRGFSIGYVAQCHETMVLEILLLLALSSAVLLSFLSLSSEAVL